MNINEKIKHLIDRSGMSRTEIADKIGVSKQSLYKYENGIITNIPSDKIEAIADLFRVSPAYLMGWDEESQEDINQGEFIAEICKKLMQLDESAQASVLALIDHLLSIKSTN